MLEKSKESRRHWTKAQKEAILREYDHGSDSLSGTSRTLTEIKTKT